MIDIIEKLEKIIKEQTRNNRVHIYVSTDDLEKLGMTPFQVKGMVYIELYKLEMLMERYERNVAEQILQKRNEDAWEK